MLVSDARRNVRAIQGSRIENLHSGEVDRQSPTGLIFFIFISPIQTKDLILVSGVATQELPGTHRILIPYI